MTLTNEAGMDITNGFCENVDLELVTDMNRKPLGNDQVVVQIAESLYEDEVLFD